MTDPREDLAAAGHVLSTSGLVTAFGHISFRSDKDTLTLTPPSPLGSLTTNAPFARLAVELDELPTGVAKEAWIHLAVASARPDVRAICRAQPETATALASAGVPIRPLHGQGSFLGNEIPVFTDPRLVRDRERGRHLAEALGDSPALIMRGNGAITVGVSVAHAVARMWVLEASARITATAAAAGTPAPLDANQQEAWRAVETELCQRIWEHLRSTTP